MKEKEMHACSSHQATLPGTDQVPDSSSSTPADVILIVPAEIEGSLKGRV